MVEETRVSVSGEAQDVGVAAVMTAPTVTAQAATDIVIPVVQLPDSSEEYGDSRDIDPAAAASAANKFAEFTSASAEVLDEGASGGASMGQSFSPWSPRRSSAMSERRRPSGRRSTRQVLRFRTSSNAPWSSIERRNTRSAR